MLKCLHEIYRSEPNNVMIHCRMLDGTAQLQQEALGILGVNLIHGCLAKSGKHNEILAGLVDDLNRRRIEVPVPHSFAHWQALHAEGTRPTSI